MKKYYNIGTSLNFQNTNFQKKETRHKNSIKISLVTLLNSTILVKVEFVRSPKDTLGKIRTTNFFYGYRETPYI